MHEQLTPASKERHPLNQFERTYVDAASTITISELAIGEMRIEGDAVRSPVTFGYDDLWRAFPLVSVTRTIECAGNRRVLFGREND